MSSFKGNRYAHLGLGCSVAVVWLLCFFVPSTSPAQTPEFAIVGMGDSIGEGVQSADANVYTQPYSYLNWVAYKIGVSFPLPFIQTGPFAFVGDTDDRFRLSPEVAGANLSVSGADVYSLLNEQADAASEAEINSETDLVLFPRIGSQIEIAEAIGPYLVICWIGNNDVLGAVLAFDELNASQMTTVEDFRAGYEELVERLGDLNSAVVLANIPDVHSIAVLQNSEDLVWFLGSDYGLPEGSFTTLPTMFLLDLGLVDGSILQDPDYVLDPGEAQQISDRVDAFNQIIAESAATIGAPVLDVNGIFRYLVQNPPVVVGIPLTRRFQGGLFSLDGVHPSNIAHLLIADEMLNLMNSHFGASFPRVTSEEFAAMFFNDPFLDKDQDKSVVGRPYAGLLETIGALTGLTGDQNDFDASVSLMDQLGSSMKNKSRGMDDQLSRDEIERAFKRMWRVHLK